MKWRMLGNTMLRWTSLPMLHSSSFGFVDLFVIISLIALDHAVNLFIGSLTVRVLKSKNQPRMVLVSSRPASAISFARAAIGSLGRVDWTG